MKNILLIFILIGYSSCFGQWPLQKAYPNKIPEPFFYTPKDRPVFYDLDTVELDGPLYNPPDTIPCIILVSDTQPINGKTDTHVYWVKGYKVIEDFDTYYLDISKRRFGSSVIFWLDQNL